MKKIFISLAVLVAAFMIAYLFCIAPNTGRRDRMKPFMETYIAHRGLFDDDEGIPENSMSAFQKAIEKGHGIELDVQTTKDGWIVVFHDADLARMTGVSGAVPNYTYEELNALRLKDIDQVIPLFQDVLEAIGGAVPLVVEIKPTGDVEKTCKLTAAALDDYDGAFCVESFDPFALKWFRQNRPDVLRGQLSTNYEAVGFQPGGIAGFAATNLLLDCVSRPDFIAYDCRYASCLSCRICRQVFGAVGVAWTVRDEKGFEAAKEGFDAIIFEGFEPGDGE